MFVSVKLRGETLACKCRDREEAETIRDEWEDRYPGKDVSITEAHPDESEKPSATPVTVKGGK